MENLIVDTSNIKILFVILLIGILGAYVYFEMRQMKDKLKQYEKTCQSLNEKVTMTMSKMLQIEGMQAYKSHDIVSEQRGDKEEQEERVEESVEQEELVEVKPVEQEEPVVEQKEQVVVEQKESIEQPVVEQEEPAELKVEPINISTEDESDEMVCPKSDIEDIEDIGENPFVSSVCESGHSILFSEIEKLMSESEIGKAEPVQDVHTFEDITCEPDIVSESESQSKSEETIDIEINDKYETMTVSQLKEKLEEYKLPVSGNKTKMKQRLRDYEESKQDT